MTLGTKISAVAKYLTVRMQSNAPLTLTLSPSDGERGWFCSCSIVSPISDFGPVREFFSLSPSDGERVGVRGRANCMDTAMAGLSDTVDYGSERNDQPWQTSRYRWHRARHRGRAALVRLRQELARSAAGRHQLHEGRLKFPFPHRHMLAVERIADADSLVVQEVKEVATDFGECSRMKFG